MKKTLALALLTFGWLAPSLAQNQPLHEFAALENTWSGDYGKGIFTETWQVLDAHTIEGWGYYIINSDTVMREYLQIRKTGSHWGYLASINGGAPTLFNLSESGANSWTFTNLEHDFPQQVRYHLNAQGELMVEVSGVINGKETIDRYALNPIRETD